MNLPAQHKSPILTPMSRQFIRFCIIGTINTGVDYSIYFILTRTLPFWTTHLVSASALAFLIANTNSYFLNRYWTFQAQLGQHRQQYPKFLAISLCGLTLSASLFHVLVNMLGSNDIIAKVAVTGVVLFWNYTANKIWTFRHAL